MSSSHRFSRDSSTSLPEDKLITQCDSVDVEMVPATFDESDAQSNKHHCPETSETDGEGLSPLNLDACIVCEISDKGVSRCSGVGCMISYHWNCLNAELGGSSKDPENPYCPCCWFNLLAIKSKSLKEKVVEAEKAVCKYLDKEMESNDDDDEVNENVPKSQEDTTTLPDDENCSQDLTVNCSTDIVSEQELQGDEDSSEEEQVQTEEKCDQSSGENILLVEETDQPEEDEVLDDVEASEEEEERVDAEKFQDAEDDKQDERYEDQTEDAGRKRDASPFLSMQESFSGKEEEQVQQNDKRRRGGKELELTDDVDSEIPSNESNNEEDATEQVTTSTQIVISTKNQEGKHSSTTKVTKSKKIVRDMSFFNKNHRRRLRWTPEEEEMLEVGVERFAAEANKNMPWRKILEMGANVFHETRNPSDLKDKWRNMIKLANKAEL